MSLFARPPVALARVSTGLLMLSRRVQELRGHEGVTVSSSPVLEDSQAGHTFDLVHGKPYIQLVLLSECLNSLNQRRESSSTAAPASAASSID